MSDINPCLSDDIWSVILQKLPVKILGKCRCVCKSWHSLVVSPSFMSTHFKNYTQNQANSLLLYREMSPKIPNYEQYVMFHDSSEMKNGGTSGLQVCHTSICPFEVRLDFKCCSHFVGCVHGLLCLSDASNLSFTGRIMLWNPMFRKYIILPESSTVSGSSDNSNLTSVLGFGYDVMKNDHRVVKITNCHGLDKSNNASRSLIEVYSVREHTWKIISSETLVNNSINSVSSSHCFMNGVIYWLTLKSGRRTPIDKWLLLFNVEEEMFDKLELPEEIVNTSLSGENFGVFEYGNKLSVSCCEYNVIFDILWPTCQIWVRKEDDVGNTWCKIIHVGVGLRDCLHMGPVEYMRRNGELLGFARESDYMLTSFDPITRRFTDLGLRLHGSTKFCNYTESLVLLDERTEVYTEDGLQRSADDRRQRRHRSMNIIASAACEEGDRPDSLFNIPLES